MKCPDTPSYLRKYAIHDCYHIIVYLSWYTSDIGINMSDTGLVGPGITQVWVPER